MKYTLITGASQGMGLEMARECASLGRNILLISLPKENLKVLSENIADKFKTSFFPKYGRKVFIIISVSRA